MYIKCGFYNCALRAALRRVQSGDDLAALLNPAPFCMQLGMICAALLLAQGCAKRSVLLTPDCALDHDVGCVENSVLSSSKNAQKISPCCATVMVFESLPCLFSATHV